MNIEKIKIVLKEYEDNSAHGIICSELENQWFMVSVEGINLAANQVFDRDFQELEDKSELRFELFKDGSLLAQFSIRFTEYHEFEII